MDYKLESFEFLLEPKINLMISDIRVEQISKVTRADGRDYKYIALEGKTDTGYLYKEADGVAGNGKIPIHSKNVDILYQVDDLLKVSSLQDQALGYAPVGEISSIHWKKSEIQDESGIKYAKVIVQQASLRTGPSTKSSVVMVLYHNDKVDILAYEQGWCKIRVGDKIGYISDKLIKKIDS